jgi:hypothetical protein
MTTTDLIKLLQSVEKGASGRSREIRISTQNKNGAIKNTVLKETDTLEIVSTGDGIAGAELSLVINAL